VLAQLQPGLPPTAGRYAANHWAISIGNDTVSTAEQFEFSARALNASAAGQYACVVSVGQGAKQRFVSNEWRTSAAVSHQLAGALLPLLALLVGYTA